MYKTKFRTLNLVNKVLYIEQVERRGKLYTCISILAIQWSNFYKLSNNLNIITERIHFASADRCGF